MEAYISRCTSFRILQFLTLGYGLANNSKSPIDLSVKFAMLKLLSQYMDILTVTNAHISLYKYCNLLESLLIF